MKKEYRAPYLAMESFQLDAAIAASCSTQQGAIWETPTGNKTPLNFTENTCVPDDGTGHFNLNNCEIDVTPPDDDGGEFYCYHAYFWYLDMYINS